MFIRAGAASITVLLCAVVVACGGGSGNAPAVVPTAASPSVTLDTFVGSWASTAPAAGGGVTANACSALKYDINRAPDNQSATVTFNATCAGFVISGTGSGALAASTLIWSTAGTISQNGASFCSFDFKNNTATAEGTDGIRINYAGTVCGVPVSGSQVVHRR